MPIVSGGNNVVSDNTCALGGANDAEGVSPLLAALADNGGQVAGIPPGQRVRTHALPPGSPAVNRAPCMGLTADQRDFARPFPVGGLCDSGAFEYRDSDGDGIEDGVDPTPFGDPPPPVVFSTPPSNAFSFGKLKRNKKKGIAFLFVKVPGPGQLGLAGPGLRPLGLGGAAKALAVAGGTVKLPIAPHKKGRKARKLRKRLKRKGKARVKARVTYVPTGGAANTKVRKLKLIRKR
jgi:hypothetical protein